MPGAPKCLAVTFLPVHSWAHSLTFSVSWEFPGALMAGFWLAAIDQGLGKTGQSLNADGQAAVARSN